MRKLRKHGSVRGRGQLMYGRDNMAPLETRRKRRTQTLTYSIGRNRSTRLYGIELPVIGIMSPEFLKSRRYRRHIVAIIDRVKCDALTDTVLVWKFLGEELRLGT